MAGCAVLVRCAVVPRLASPHPQSLAVVGCFLPRSRRIAAGDGPPPVTGRAVTHPVILPAGVHVDLLVRWRSRGGRLPPVPGCGRSASAVCRNLVNGPVWYGIHLARFIGIWEFNEGGIVTRYNQLRAGPFSASRRVEIKLLQLRWGVGEFVELVPDTSIPFDWRVRIEIFQTAVDHRTVCVYHRYAECQTERTDNTRH